MVTEGRVPDNATSGLDLNNGGWILIAIIAIIALVVIIMLTVIITIKRCGRTNQPQTPPQITPQELSETEKDRTHNSNTPTQEQDTKRFKE